MKGKVIEVVEFRLNVGVEVKSFLDAAQETAVFVRSLDGFVRRSLSQSEKGVWFDIVEWRDMASAQAAGDRFMLARETAAFCEMIDMDTAKVQHLMTAMTC